MAWFDTDGNMSENILFSKFTYTRNLAGKQGDVSEVIGKIEAVLKKNGFHTQKIQKDDKYKALSYCEKQYVDEDFCAFTQNKAIFFNEPCSLCISVGGANLISIYAILPGASVRDAHKISSSAEELLDAEFDFAYDEALGYLSPLPHTCGSGIRISCALYLPLLTRADKISSLSRTLASFGISLYPIFPKSAEADIYIMTYSPHLSQSEDTCVEAFDKLIRDVVALEREELKQLGAQTIFNIAEDAARALGILAYSGSLSECELISLCSDIRLCLSAGCSDRLLRNITPASLNTLSFEGLSASVLLNAHGAVKSQAELDCERAMQVRRILLSLPEKNALVNT